MSQPPNTPDDVPSGERPASASTGSGYPPPSAGAGDPQQPAGAGYSQPQGWSYPSPPSGSGYPPPGGSGYPSPGGTGYPPPGWGYPPPPPAGGYPAPGGFPPPPPGGYPPPPPPQGGYAPPPPGYGMRPAYSVGEAFGWAWNKFTKNAGPLIVATLVFALVILGITGLMFWLLRQVSPETFSVFDTAGGVVETTALDINGVGMAVMILGWLILAVVSGVVASAWYCGLLDIANGQPVTVGSFFRPRNAVAVVLAALLVGLVSSVVNALGAMVPIVGPLLSALVVALIGIFTFFTTVSIVDRNLSPIDGIRASIDVAKTQFGQVLLAWLVLVAVTFVGALLCLVGLLVALPVAYLFKVYTWRRLTGNSVAPAVG